MPTPPGAARPRVRLHPDWRTILRRAWSIRLLVFASILSGAEAALPFLDGFGAIPRGLVPALSFIVTAAAFVARLLAQNGVSNEQA